MSKTTWNLPKYPQNLKNEQSTCETSKLAKTPKNQQNDKKKKKKTQTAKMNSTPLTTIFKTTKTLFNLQNGKKKS